MDWRKTKKNKKRKNEKRLYNFPNILDFLLY